MSKKSETQPGVAPVKPLTLEQVRDISIQAPNMPVLYFNHSRVAVSNFDIRIYFGQGNITARGDQSLVEQLCVILTPEFAASFFQTLKTTLETYEQKFGKIRQAPPKILPSTPEGTEQPAKRKKPN